MILMDKTRELKKRIAELERELKQVKAERNALSEVIKNLQGSYQENPAD